MSKVRINDLARELEVKSKAILDTLPLVGVTEKKTHSSSLEEHEAEKVRVYLRSTGEGSASSGKTASRQSREDEIKTKIDLSNISRPGDVLKAITQRKEAAAPSAIPQRPVVSPVVPAPAEKPVTAPLAGVSRPTTVAPPVARPPAPSVITPPVTAPSAPAPFSTRPAPAPPASSAPPMAPLPPRFIAPPSTAHVPSAAQPAASAPSSISPSVPPPAPMVTSPAVSSPPAPRMIVPQTGPRPVYKAPIRPTPPPVQ
ncbi:MAG: translation initiation factor IF-2 N-terminal domain-containing protein, partial [Candidatus Sulfotelmatobacter sp.]